MYCSDCGTQLPERANFCWQCGKAQNTAAKTSKVQEETCEIDFEHVAYRVFSNRWKFWAKAIGAKGIYHAGESPVFDGEHPSGMTHPVPQVRAALDKLTEKLVRDGWQPTGNKGGFWYSYMFKRQVR